MRGGFSARGGNEAQSSPRGRGNNGGMGWGQSPGGARPTGNSRQQQQYNSSGPAFSGQGEDNMLISNFFQ